MTRAATAVPALHDRIAAEIAADGPMPLARYMARALLDPRGGYYTTAEPFGARGDFITAPEISQVFGEVMALWLAQCWLDQGAPAAPLLVEPGPGRGTLMADALRALKAVPPLREGLRVRLVEASPRLCTVQEATLAPLAAGIDLGWAETLDAALDAGGGPLLLLANEFLDALPIRQFRREGDRWHEVLVGLAPNGALAPVLAPDPVPESAVRAPGTAPLPAAGGAVVERCPAAEAAVAAIAARIAAGGGAALLVDYGYGERPGRATFRAYRGHDHADPFAAPGTADLTASVDFAALAETARAAGAAAFGPVTQRDLLLALGAEARTAALCARATPAQAGKLRSGLARLTDAADMGEAFKALAILPPGSPPPPGFGDPA
ncbi:class I SAM-dependent methyltransferase [Futiania mangrovi]|uniref:SAM-dependent methyltransferase n=1 Tax=Futiania mangrovi TaxID=2959716 RepID=A0A9J6PLG5_9PROT|nr:SAM-dependent methyltransferase [Futiania mangrovii]MCP1337479.1 SAM-dependent methyltransferase [Futiania mangrovii]